MNDFFAQIFIPNMIFFIGILIVFSILEGLIVLFLLWLEKRNRNRVMLLMLRVYKHYRKVNFIFRMAGVLFAVGAVWLIWYLVTPLSEKPEVTLFAVIMLFVITIVYLILTHFKGRLSIRKRRDRALYLGLSMVLCVVMLVFIDQKFPDYRRYVVRNVVYQTMEAYEEAKGIIAEDRLIKQFRRMVRKGECPPIDYRTQKFSGVIRNFFYVTTDLEFKVAVGEATLGNLDQIAVGRVCTNDETTYILTHYGRWYWVVDTKPEV